MNERIGRTRYSVIQTLRESQGILLCRAIREKDHRTVVLKAIDPRSCAQGAVKTLRHEHEITRMLDPRAIVRPIGLDTFRDMPALVLEDFPGEPLDRLLGKPMALEPFLDLAIAITALVADVHRQGIVHKDLTPENILFDRQTLGAKLTGFGAATRNPREQQPFQPPQVIEGTLPYLAPEQTGRMNRAVDSRSDLYSLGVTFFQMLTGRLPFEADDPLEWVHCHVAREPPSPTQLVPDLPEAVAHIILKLLAKMADDRYQSARGLHHDLERCLAEWQASRRVVPFRLGERDVVGPLHVPEELFGREQERSALLAAFERVVATGGPELLLVSGASGVGKSSLVHELLRPLVLERGLFLEGKYDQHAKNIPYASMAQAFGQLVLDLLVDTEEHRASWARAIRDALGARSRLVMEVIPSLRLLLEEPPVPHEIAPTGKEQQVRRALRDFVGVFTREDRPLVLFADDLQWADPASLALLETLIADPSMRHLLLVGAFRCNEVGPDHPLRKWVDRIRAARASVTEMVLPPLDLEHVVDLVAETVRATRTEARPLAVLVHERTRGNPLFVVQLLATLYDEHLIRFDERDWAWRWDVARIAEHGDVKDVADLLARKLAALPSGAGDLLRVAACLRNQAPLAVLAAAHGSSEEQARVALRDAVMAGLVTRARGRYTFTHDRVQQAAYERIPEESRSAVHLRIGRSLRERLPHDQWEEWIFEIVGQLNLGHALVTDQDERTDLAELNLRAGRKAAAAAHLSALKYFTAGEALLPRDGWESRYELTYELKLERARCEWLCGNFNAAASRVPEVLQGARSRVDRAAVYALKVRLLLAQSDFEKACQAARFACSSLFGIDLPLHPTQAELRDAAFRILANLGHRAIEDLLDLPMITDPDVRAAIALLSASLPAVYRIDPNLHDLMCCHIVDLTLQHGTSPFSPHGYVMFGAMVGRLFDDWEKADLFGTVACRLVERARIVEGTASTYYTVAAFIRFWVWPFRKVVPLFRTSRRAAVEEGDTNIAAYAAENIVLSRLCAGDPLGEVASETEIQLAFVHRTGYFETESGLQSLRQTLSRLQGTPVEPPEPAAATPPRHLFEIGLEALADLLLGNAERARSVIRDSKALAESGFDRGMIHEAEYCFVSALVLAVNLDRALPEKNGDDLAAIVACQEKLRRWQQHCPANFRGRYVLVSAELARIEGHDVEAMRLYEEAIAAARQSGFTHDEAVSFERAAAYYHARGFTTIATAYLREARGCYLRWGADAKVQDLDRRLQPIATLPPGGTAPFSVRPEHLDLVSVLKASQTISSAIVQEDLVRTLLHVTLQEGGAQRACLLVSHDGALRVEAEAIVVAEGVRATLLQSVPLGGPPLVPTSFVDYVMRNKERVIVDDAPSDAGRRLFSDPYFAHKQPRSVLCLPILRQAEVAGVLYLENELAAGAFTPERLAALALIASQAAIALENARLLEQERAARATAESAEHRSAFLAQAGVLLSETLDYQDTLTRLVRLCVGSLADWCVIDLAEGAHIHRVASAHVDPTKDLLLTQLQREHPSTWHSPHPAAMCLRTGRPILLSDMTETELRSLCEDEDHFQIVRALGTASTVSVPLTTHGTVLGALTLSSKTPHRYENADLELMQEVAHRAAIALENAMLYSKALRLSEAERRQAEAEAANRTKDAFLAMLSHELRNPLAPILTALHLARTTHGSSPERQLTIIERQTRRLTKLVDDLLDVSRITQGKIQLQRQRIEVSPAIAEAIEVAGPLLEERGHELTVDVPRSGLLVDGDPDRLIQVFANLLTNAAKYTEPHGHVAVSARREGRSIVVHVCDDGIGIAPDLLPRIFEIFVQDQRAFGKARGGLGIGLSLAMSLVKLHGGTLSVASELGKGSTFTVTLPVADVGFDEVEAQAPA